MKIRSIRLAAYGPFTDVTIDLHNSGTGFSHAVRTQRSG